MKPDQKSPAKGVNKMDRMKMTKQEILSKIKGFAEKRSPILERKGKERCANHTKFGIRRASMRKIA
jgi:hypothetical protein